jgi:YbbR domain-containing protein
MARKLFVKHILQKIFLEDWALKLVALAITFGLWFGVTGLSTPTTRRISVPLNLSISSNAQVTSSPQKEIEIEISGDKRRIEEIDRSGLSASVDLTEFVMGELVVDLSPKTVSVQLPPGVKLVDVTPGRIAVTLENVEERELEVKANVVGVPAAGHEVYGITILPARIRVRGPASVVRSLESIQTAAIDIAGKKENVNMRQMTVPSSDPQATVIDSVVDVLIRIGEKRIERSYSVPVTGGQGRIGSFSLVGEPSVVTKIRPDELRVEAFLSNSGEEAHRVVLPPDVANLVEVRRLRVTP